MVISASDLAKSISPKNPNASPTRSGSSVGASVSASASNQGDPPANAPTPKLFALPPRPGRPQQQQQHQQPGSNTPSDYYPAAGGSLSLEPNPFEQSFGVGGGPETPGGTKLPSVAALTSPSSLLPGNWGSSLRTGPLSPAMLSGPANDYFSESHHLRGSFTPNESSLRSGLTPGGSGSMFPAPSPNTQALFSQIATSGATPSTIDFHRAALSAATKREQNKVPQRPLPLQQQQHPHQQSQQAQSQQQQQQQPTLPPPPPPSQAQPMTSKPQELPSVSTSAVSIKAEPLSKPTASGPFDPHDNDAANGLFLLAQGRSTTQSSNQYSVNTTTATAPVPLPAPAPVSTSLPPPVHASNPAISTSSGMPSIAPGALPPAIHTSPHMPGAPIGIHGQPSMSRGGSEGSIVTDDSDQMKPPARGRMAKKNMVTAAAGSRRKAEESPSKGALPPHKKPRAIAGPSGMAMDDQSDDEDMGDGGDDKNGENSSKPKMNEDEKRKNFLERNRVAALKCRQRKKQWLQNLQHKVELYTTENDALTQQITTLREEVVNLKTLLLAHKDCPVTQQQNLHGNFMGPVVEPYQPQMNPYGMAAPLPPQQVIAGQLVQRRFS